jgi:hypothetical protein
MPVFSLASTTSGADGMGAGFIIRDNHSNTDTITTNDGVTFGGTGLDATIGSGSVDLSLDISEYSDVTPAHGDKLLTLDSNGSTEQLTTLHALGTLFSGTGLTVSGSSTLVTNYTDGQTEIILTDASDFATTGSGTINETAFTWSGKSNNTLTVPDLDANYSAGVAVISLSSSEINIDSAQSFAISSMTSSTSRTITTPLLSVESTAASKPVVQIKNTANDQTGSELRFVMDKGAAGAVNDVSGAITFYSDDAGQTNQAFGKIQTKTIAATADSEAGEIGFSVATTNGASAGGALAEVLLITGGVNAATSTVDVKGHLIVRGTTTTVDSTTIDVADVNINLGNGVGNDAAVDGGGITLESTETNKTFNWVDGSDAWTSNQHMNLLTGKAYKITDGSSTVQSVLSVDTLGSTVLASSLTSVGTLTALTVDQIEINGSTIGTTDAGEGDLLTLTSGLVTVDGELSATTLDIGGINISATATELNYLDLTATIGTVSASEAIVVDADKDMSGFRNLTATGAVQGGTLSADAVAIIDTAEGNSESINGETALLTIVKGTYRAAKILYHIKKDGAVDTDAGEILITHNDTNAFLTQYAEVSTGSAVIGTWDATVNGTDIEVRFDPTSDGAHTYSIVATKLITEIAP